MLRQLPQHDPQDAHALSLKTSSFMSELLIVTDSVVHRLEITSYL